MERRQWLHEPLVHFAVIGLILWAVDAWVMSGADNPRQITVTPSVYTSLSEAFVEGNGRLPTAGELRILAESWVSNEVLYREAKAMQLDQGDEMIRERIIQKKRVMIGGSLTLPEPSEQELRAWYDDNRGLYELPVSLDFSFARIAEGEAAARQLAARWNALEDREPGVTPGVRLLNFDVRPRPNVVGLLGEATTAQLEALPPGEWTPIEGSGGWAVMRLDQIDPARTLPFEEVVADVRKRWGEWRTQTDGNQMVADMRARYDVAYADVPAEIINSADPDTLPPARTLAATPRQMVQ